MFNKNFKSFFEEMQNKYELLEINYIPINYCGGGLNITFDYKRREQICPECKSEHTIIHEYKSRTVKSGTMNGVPVTFEFKHCRYKCNDCGTTFMERFEFLPFNKGISTDAENYIVTQLGSVSFSDIAAEIGVCVQTIANRAIKYGEEEKAIQISNTYKYLSMDEVFVTRNEEGEAIYYWVLNDNSIKWKSNNIFIYEGRTKEEVIKRLESLKNKERIEAVSIDMWRPYYDAILEVLPNAEVVIDPFHVIKIAESKMDLIRKNSKTTAEIKKLEKKDAKLFLKWIYKLKEEEMERLEEYLKDDKNIEKSYFIVQELLSFYHIKGYEEALEFIAKWEIEVVESGIEEMKEILKIIENWLPHIMNYFKYGITNGRTEGKNQLIRVIDRIGFHYGLESIQGCVYAHDRKQELIKWRKYQDRKYKSLDLTA